MSNTDLLATLETSCQDFARKHGCTIAEARMGMRLHIAKLAAAMSGPETANKYCEQFDLPIRFEALGDKVAMVDAPSC